jgi:hypothetical protein
MPEKFAVVTLNDLDDVKDLSSAIKACLKDHLDEYLTGHVILQGVNEPRHDPGYAYNVEGIIAHLLPQPWDAFVSIRAPHADGSRTDWDVCGIFPDDNSDPGQPNVVIADYGLGNVGRDSML